MTDPPAGISTESNTPGDSCSSLRSDAGSANSDSALAAPKDEDSARVSSVASSDSAQRTPRWVQWLRTYKVVFSVAATFLTLIAIVVAIFNATAASRNADNAASSSRQAWRMFELQRRPWLVMVLDSAGLDSSGDSPRFRATSKIRNSGQGAASRFFCAFTLLNTRQPIAETVGLNTTAVPTGLLTPSAVAEGPGPDFPIGANPLRPGVRYVHGILLYYGAETGAWYYNEHVYYVNLEYDPKKSAHPAPWYGPEITYLGRLVNGEVVLDDSTFVDHACRSRAQEWLYAHVGDFAPADTARAEVAAESLLRRAGFDTLTANYVAARWRLSTVQVPKAQ